MLSVALIYDLTRRHFGRAAGFVAGLVLALTPITVAISRHNNPDALLVLCCVAALWFLVRAFEDGRTRWIVLSGVAIGLGFETKMAAALIVVPALAAAYLYLAPRGRLTAVKQLAAGGVAMAATGLAWPVLVWLTPAGSRPWVSGTSDNSIWSLITGYNGLGRVDGQAGGPGGGGPGGGPGGGGGGPFGGDSGPLRLLNEALGGQAGWLLGFAIAGAIAIGVVTRLRRDDARTAWLIAVGGAFATVAVTFSFAQGIFHPYYVSQLAPFTAALVGAGAVTLVRGGAAMRVLAPLAVAGGIWAEIKILGDGSTVAGVGGARRAGPRHRGRRGAGDGRHAEGPRDRAGRGARRPADRAGVVGGRHARPPDQRHVPRGRRPDDGRLRRPAARRDGRRRRDRRRHVRRQRELTSVAAYVQQHGGGTIALSSQMGASSAVIQTDADVAAIGGFSGRESQVSVEWLADAVESGQIRWVLTGGEMSGGPGGDSRTGSTDVMSAAAQTCTAVSGQSGLYDCQGKANALRALGN